MGSANLMTRNDTKRGYVNKPQKDQSANYTPNDLVIFNICLKHPKNSNDYPAAWNLLKETLYSVCNQTVDKFRVIVVCNKILDKFEDDPKIKNVDFIEVDWGHVGNSPEGWPQTGIWAARYDKSTKYTIGIVKAKEYNPRYIMNMDADDFISNTLAETVLNIGDKNGYFINRGYVLIEDNVCKRFSFYDFCGTCHIYDFDLLCSQMNYLDGITLDSKPYEIQEKIDFPILESWYNKVSMIKNEEFPERVPSDDINSREGSLNGHLHSVKTKRNKLYTMPGHDCTFMDFILGSHRWQPRYFLKLGRPFYCLTEKELAVYNLNHDDHHSCNFQKAFVDEFFTKPRKITQEVIDEFSISERALNYKHKWTFEPEVSLND